ncbi:MAG TPA: penicillin-binding protein 2 [Gaiellaceae bacterium]|nr:penicillin-binding protein 2 [Gaiellaceae bacterium]
MTPQLALRVAVLGFVALAVFAVLFLRLWALQVLAGSKYRHEASDNRVRTISVDAPRGWIIDRNGHPLVDNVLGTSLEIWPADLPKGRKARATELNALSMVTSIPVKQIVAHIKLYANDPLTPVVLRRGIHSNQYDYLKEHQQQFPGVEMPESYLRNYPYQSLLAQILGYVGPISRGELKGAEKAGYQPQDVMGQAGIEQSYDRYLKGTDGSDFLTVNSLGEPTSQIQAKVVPQQGNTLRLTIDVRLQRAAERALQSEIVAARTAGETYADGGAIVALDPRNGAVLAMASNPTYQPSVYVGRDPDKLAPLQNPKVAAEQNYPGLNRAIDGFYPPGSVWKPVTALAAMEEGVLTPTESLQCTPSFSFFQQTFTNWDPYVDQPMELGQALAQSCDTYFYRVGASFYDMNASRGPTLQLWASRFGFGEPTGIDVGPENPGLVPTPDWLKKAYPAPKYPLIDRVWKPGYSVQLAIGQGDLEVTPIQMARFYAMIANGGQLVTPHIAEDVESSTGDPQQRQVLRVLATQQTTPSGVDPTYLAAVQQGLWLGTHSIYGTSYGVFGQFPVPIAGKTGTAEKDVTLPGYPHAVKLSQSWWCGYGPYNDPTIVVCAVIENGGHGGTAAAPAALQVFESYFKRHGVTTSHLTD